MRFMTYLFPDKIPWGFKLLLLPFKVILYCYFSIIMPALCHYLDKFDRDRRFTVGYFVEAIKK